jgi:hypothetical protein
MLMLDKCLRKNNSSISGRCHAIRTRQIRRCIWPLVLPPFQRAPAPETNSFFSRKLAPLRTAHPKSRENQYDSSEISQGTYPAKDDARSGGGGGGGGGRTFDLAQRQGHSAVGRVRCLKQDPLIGEGEYAIVPEKNYVNLFHNDNLAGL